MGLYIKILYIYFIFQGPGFLSIFFIDCHSRFFSRIVHGIRIVGIFFVKEASQFFTDGHALEKFFKAAFVSEMFSMRKFFRKQSERVVKGRSNTLLVGIRRTPSPKPLLR